MISKSEIKKIQALTLKKNRQEQHLFIAEGPKVVDELLHADIKIEKIFALPEWLEKNEAGVKVDIVEINETELKKISALTTPNQVLVVAAYDEPIFDATVLQRQWVLALDNIKDPGNMGTIIRIADWFGIHHVICSENCVEIYNSKTVQASMGSLFHVNVFHENLNEFLKQSCFAIKTFGAFLEGENLYNTQFPPNGLLVIGSESHGISAETEILISNKITIPRGKGLKSEAESLNASVATAIICSEISRQQWTERC
jgi:TrmH family RNA methyltransferase